MGLLDRRTRGRRLVKKTISARGSQGLGDGVFASGDTLQDIMNRALAEFVQKVATDPGIVAVIAVQR